MKVPGYAHCSLREHEPVSINKIDVTDKFDEPTAVSSHPHETEELDRVAEDKRQDGECNTNDNKCWVTVKISC